MGHVLQRQTVNSIRNCFFVILTTVVILVVFYKSTTQASLPKETFFSEYVDRRLRYNQGHPSRSTNGHHDILWWNVPLWMKHENWVGYCNTSLCEYPNCRITYDRNDINKSSAVIISLVDDGAEHVPVPRAERNGDQAWVFFTLESPMSFWHPEFGTSEEWRNVFNWSMTYRQDADISIPYGWLSRRQRAPSYKNYSAIFRNKKGTQASWIVSHCTTSGKREAYIEELKKYIDVDVYGACGRKIEHEDFVITVPRYKFYLAFENALCKDYFTEKYFGYYQYDTIIVVRGLSEYSKYLPNNTFINTSDFPSIESLGKHLQNLANNEEEYIWYLKQKDRYEATQSWDTYCDGICNICEKLNNLDANRRTYDNIFDWAGGCESPTDLH